MIELRWVPVEMAQHISSEFFVADGESRRVLQYRQQVVKGAWASEPPSNAPTEWSAWIDVPTAPSQ
jgi:hypothetical protein